jgi:hypothetical protein
MEVRLRMKPHMTSSWLRKYANLYKQASYQDKLDAVFLEKNPYYLIEWLLFDPAVEEAEAIRFQRSPSMVKNSYIDFDRVFFGEIVYETALRACSQVRIEELLVFTAIRDLREYYGETAWQEAVRRLDENIHFMMEQYGAFTQQLEQELLAVTRKYETQLQEINEQYDEDSEDKKLQVLNAWELFEQRKNDTPRKLLQKHYLQWPLVSFIHYNRREWAELWNLLKGRLLQPQDIQFLSYVDDDHHQELFNLITGDAEERKLFKQWFSSYASKTLMTVEYADIESRQEKWIKFLVYMDSIQGNDKQVIRDILAVTFDLRGVDEVMMRESVIPPYLHRLVALALDMPDYRRWLREVIVLRYWPIFLQRFVEPSYRYEELSWVLCLDPENLEQKLIRNQIDLPFIIDRCCQIFSDGIRAGMQVEMMVPLFQYLTVHHIDFMHSYIQKIHHAEELIPLLHMDESYLQRIFGGKGVRAVSSRRRVHPIFLAWISRTDASSTQFTHLKQLSTLLIADKSELLQQWLNPVLAADKGWPEQQAGRIADLLQFEWLGQPGSSDAEHGLVEAWLEEHSDWIKFELDAEASRRQGVKYRIIRPGSRDLNTGRILGRVLVRSEWTDAAEISSFLDDLKNI